MPELKRRCTKCGQVKNLETDFYVNEHCRGGKSRWCKECQNSYTRAYIEKRHADPRHRLIASSKSNAYSRGIEHSISVDDLELPQVCPYLGIVIDYRRASERGRLRAYDAPSIDRIDSGKGYVSGNVQIISDLANRMKQDATIDQLLAFAEGVLRIHGTQTWRTKS